MLKRNKQWKWLCAGILLTCLNNILSDTNLKNNQYVNKYMQSTYEKAQPFKILYFKLI